MKRCAALGFIVLSVSFWSLSIQADPVRTYRPHRAGMMGHAGLALEGSSESAYLNPASLADVTESEWEVFPILVEVPYDQKLFRRGIDYAEAADSDSATDSEKRQKLERFLETASTTSLGARFSFNPNYTRPNMHVGLWVEGRLDADGRLAGFASNQLMEAGDSHFTGGGVVAYAMSFLKDKLQVGASGKALYRISPFEEEAQRIDSILIGMNSGSEVKDQLIGDKITDRKAFGLGLDIGMKYWFSEELWDNPTYKNLLTYLRPAVGFTWQDVGNTRFFRSSGRELPKDIPQSMSVGIGLHPEWSFVKSRFALDIRNLTERKAFMSRIHLGWESVLWNIWALRAGLSQGYITLGTGVNFWLAQLDVYATAQESGDFARVGVQRSVGARLTLGF